MNNSSNDTDRRIQAVWGYVGVPPSLAHATLDNYRPGCPEQQEALDKCREFARQGLQNISRGRGLVLKGSVGTGKSHLSVAMVRAMIEASPERFGKPFSSLRVLEDIEYPGCRCSMIPVFDLLERLRESYSSRRPKTDHAQLIRRCKFDDLVILDDIGAEKSTEWVEEQLYGLIDLRYRFRRSTLLTTNCSLTQLEGKMGTRALSRILEMCECIGVGGDDWRKTHR
ncbi:MAG: ATP-binding protein [Syntrophomonadaceae bacterium]